MTANKRRAFPIVSTSEMVTPEMAKELMQLNTGNFRKLDVNVVTKYANDMSAGAWMTNGDTIKISGTKVLLDGQHRLMAIIKSGVTVQCLIVRDLTALVGHTIDDGKARTAAHWLAHNNVKNANKLAATAKMVVLYNKGYWALTGVDAGRTPTRTEIIEYGIQNQEALQTAIQLGIKGSPLVSCSTLSSIIYVAAGGEDAKQFPTVVWFADRLSLGDGLSSTDPVFHLRARLTKAAGTINRLTEYHKRMLVTIAWNKTAAGDSIKKLLKFSTTGPTRTVPPDTILLTPELTE